MKKNVIHDIKPSARVKKKQDTQIKTRTVKTARGASSATPTRRPRATKTIKEENPRSGSGKGVWFIAVICIIALAVGLSYIFTGAEVVVTPQTLSTEIRETFSARKTSSGSGLVFDLVVVDDVLQKTISAEEKSFVEESARGVVTLMNDHSDKEQRLLIDTRLESESGLIYKTVKEIVVPGQKNVDGDMESGTLDVEVYADGIGEEYNLEEGSFKIAGFKNRPKYETFSAVVKDPIVGGFVGDRYVVDEEMQTEVSESLQTELLNLLLDRAQSEIPADNVFYENLVVTKYADPVIQQSGEGQVTLSQSATLYAFTFGEDLVTNYFVDTNLAGIDPGDVYVRNINNLNVSFVNKSVIARNPSKIQIVQFNLDDTLDVVFNVDSEALMFDLKGKKKKQFRQVVAQHPSIKSAELIIKPFWRGTIPLDREDIVFTNTVTE
jgi:hypothetical protein